MTWFSTRRKASVGKRPLSGMPPAKDTTAVLDGIGVTARDRSSSAPRICAFREKSPDQSSATGGAAGDATGTPPLAGRAATKVPCPTWARAQPAATSSSYASDTVPRLTPSCRASSRVAGSFIPGVRSRSWIRRSRCAWIWRGSAVGLSRLSGMFTPVCSPAKPFWPESSDRQGPIGLISVGHFPAARGRALPTGPPGYNGRARAVFEGIGRRLSREVSRHGGRGTHQAGREVDRRPARRYPERGSRQARRRGVTAVRSLAARRGLPAPPPRRAGEEEMSDAHPRRVQEQFGGSAGAYVASPLHAAGGDLERLLARGAARRGGPAPRVATRRGGQRPPLSGLPAAG